VTRPSAGARSSVVVSVERLLDAAKETARDQAAAAAVDGIRGRLLGPLRVAIAGKVKAGKSTLLNALVGEQLAPTDAGECTSIVTWYREGGHPAVTLVPYEGQPMRTRFTRSDGALNVDLGGRTPTAVRSLHVDWPTSRLRDLTLIDTPGIESLSTDLSAKTLQVLTPDEDRPPEVDAVLYLLRHAHASDARFLESFHDDELARGTPINTVGVLSRADEIGSCRLDALEVAERVASRYRTEPRLKRLCPVIVPVAGLVGHAGVTLREHEFAQLVTLAHGDRGEVEELLLTADRLANRPSRVPISPEDRTRLLDRFGLFGVRLAVELITVGEATSSTALAQQFTARSGLDDLRSVLLRQFAGRSQILKARSALLAVGALVRAGGSTDPARLNSLIEQITAGAHAFEEVRLIERLHTEQFAFPADRIEDLERLLGGSGHDAATRLGLPSDTGTAELRAAADEALDRWRAVTDHPLTGRREQSVSQTACRTLEGILAELV
jgi:Dynamin family